MDKKKAEGKRRQEDRAINRVLLWFGGAVLFELYVLLIDRLYVRYNAAWAATTAYQFGFVLLALGIVFAVLAVGCVLWLIARRRAGGGLLLPCTGLVAAIAFSAASFVARHWYGRGVQVLFASGVMIAVLAMVFYLYQREFFAVAVLSGGTLLCMWLFRTVVNQRLLVYVAFAALGAAAVAVALFARVLQKGGGMLTVKGQLRRVLSKRAAYPMLYAACGITAASLAAAIFLGAPAAYYTMFALSAWLFVAAVYFTIKLM